MVEQPVEKVAVCRFDELADGSATLVTVRGHKIALSRIGDEVFAMRDACPHKGGSLSLGRVAGKRTELICPWHFFRFDLRTGASVTNPGLLNKTYPVTIDNGNILVELQRPRAAATDTHGDENDAD